MSSTLWSHFQYEDSSHSSSHEPIEDVRTTIEPRLPFGTDWTSVFTVGHVWPDMKSMVDYFYALGLEHNMVITTKRSRRAKDSKRGSVELTCENYGAFSKIPNKVGKTKRSTRTKISGCPFELRGVESIHGSWSMRVVNGMHNHHLPERLLGHAYAARLSPHGIKHVESQSAAGTPPKAVLLGLENQD